MSFSTSSDLQHATRDLGARIDGEREVRCLLKGAQVIAAGRCAEQQVEGCFCPAGYGALRALELLTAETDRGNEDKDSQAERKRWRVELVQLRARAAGFAKSGQEFAGPALSHMNRELQRKRGARIEREAQIVEELQDPNKSARAVGKQVVGDDGARPCEEKLAGVGASTSSAPTRVVTSSQVNDRRIVSDGQRGSLDGGPPTSGAAAKRCKVEGCTSAPLRSTNRSGLCATHYQREYNGRHSVAWKNGVRVRTSHGGLAAPANEVAKPVVLPVSPPQAEVAKAEVLPLTDRLAAWQQQGRELRVHLEAEREKVITRLEELQTILQTLPKE